MIWDSYFYPANTYQLDAKHILRTQTSSATLRAIKGRQTPVCLLTAGRVFRSEKEDDRHMKVFNQLDGIRVAADASPIQLQETIQKLISVVLGSVDIRFRKEDWGWIDEGTEVEVKVNDKWVSVAGCGMLKSETLREAGHNPDQVRGYAFVWGWKG